PRAVFHHLPDARRPGPDGRVHLAETSRDTRLGVPDKRLRVNNSFTPVWFFSLSLVHQLFDVTRFDRDELREVLVPRVSNEDHVFESHSKVFVFKPHLRLDREHAAWLERR